PARRLCSSHPPKVRLAAGDKHLYEYSRFSNHSPPGTATLSIRFASDPPCSKLDNGFNDAAAGLNPAGEGRRRVRERRAVSHISVGIYPPVLQAFDCMVEFLHCRSPASEQRQLLLMKGRITERDIVV